MLCFQSAIQALQYSRRNIMEKSIHFTSFSKEIFPIYFEHNRNSIES